MKLTVPVSFEQQARDLGAMFDQRDETFDYCPGYWYSQHPEGELHKTIEEAAQEYLRLMRSDRIRQRLKRTDRPKR